MGGNPSESESQLKQLLDAILVFGDDHRKYVSSSIIQAMGQEMGPLLAEALVRGVRKLLQELEANPKDCEEQWMGLYLFRRFLWGSSAVRDLISANKDGVLKLLARTIQNHMNDVRIQGEVMWLLFEIGGLSPLLDILCTFSNSSALVRMCLRQIKDRCQAQTVWWEWINQPWERSLAPVFAVMEAHQHDTEILGEALWFLQEFIWDASFRDAFGSRGGWIVVLKAMEAQTACRAVQYAGCRAIVGLGSKGGAWGGQWESRAAAAVGAAVQAHSTDEDLLRWAFWALKEVNGVGALLKMLQRPAEALDLKTSIAIFGALGEMHWGQADSLDVDAACEVVQRAASWLHQGTTWSSRELTASMQGALVCAARFIAPSPVAEMSPLGAKCGQALRVAVETYCWIIQERLTEAATCDEACKGIGDIYRYSQKSSPIRSLVKQWLFEAPAEGGVPSLQRLSEAHISHGDLQSTIFWTMGVVCGPRPVLDQMSRHMTSQEIQLQAVKSIGCLYDEDDVEDLSEEINAARADALKVVVRSMTTFANNKLLCQHCCFAISALIVPSSPVGLDDAAFLQTILECLLHVIRGDDGYPQKEACRAIATLLPGLVAFPNAIATIKNATGVREALENTVQERVRWAPWQRQSARDSRDGVDAIEHEEGLMLALTALGFVAGVEIVIATLEKGVEAEKPCVVMASAQAVVELARLGAGPEFYKHLNTLSVVFCRCFEMRLDPEVHRALELASGFCTPPKAVAA